MLLQFVVENYKSFSQETILSLLPNPDDDKSRPLNIVVIYGANAAGKSNLLEAMRDARATILDGTPAQKRITAARPCKLSQEEDRPTRFGFEIFVGGKHYSYGFSILPDCVYDEFLFVAKEDGGEDLVFERDTEEQGQVLKWGDQFWDREKTIFLDFLWKTTRKNQLILHEMLDREVEELTPVVSWFLNNILFDDFNHQREEDIDFNQNYYELMAKITNDEKFKIFFINFISGFETGIVDVDIKNIRRKNNTNDPLATTRLTKKLAQKNALKSANQITSAHALVDSVDFLYNNDIVFFHESKENTPFLWEQESEGTRRLAILSMYIFEILHGKEPILFVADEFERSLHPLISQYILKTIAENKSIKGQIILTTHNTNILLIDELSNDSICFVEKDRKGHSSVYSLSNFKDEQVKVIRQNLEFGYLLGRFGAIPVLRPGPALLRLEL